MNGKGNKLCLHPNNGVEGNASNLLQLLQTLLFNEFNKLHMSNISP